MFQLMVNRLTTSWRQNKTLAQQERVGIFAHALHGQP